MRVIGTGVTLTVANDPASPSEELDIWPEVEGDGEVRRWWGQAGSGMVELGDDPTSALMDAAEEQRALGLGGVLGDMRRAGHDVTRFECYAAPFRVELTNELRARLSGTWRERDPQVEEAPDPWLPPG